MGCMQSRMGRHDAIITDGALPISTSDSASTQLKEFNPPKWASDEPMTLEQLQSQRDAFWDTAPAYEGKPEVWEALRRLCECSSLSEARAVAEAVPLNFPTGKVTDGCYDTLGNFYLLPSYCLSLPSNLSSSPPTIQSPSNGSEAPLLTPDPFSQKTLVDGLPAPNMKVRIRFNTSEDLLAEVSRQDTLAQVRERIILARGWGADAPSIRFIYLGKILAPTSTLLSHKISDDSVIQAQVSDFKA
ncbi:Ubiquitin domain-containing protein 1 [Entomophthora muscae]|uniref:Ubiquitin domain-containing protein 1 n=1 Tax=Entomophthora muscae TaxID=34485 RepID=A0ACC2RM97_9FUNG|nr:Ubiquitin domain-containing protein 1 [Entomophthora muscae]